MLLAKFQKINSAAFIPHLDLIRAVGMTFRRADFSVEYSAGFNPHMLVFFCQPLPLGTASTAEYFWARVHGSAQDFVAGFNSNAPSGLVVSNCVPLDTNPNLHSLACYARYLMRFEGISEGILRSICLQIIAEKITEIKYKNKGEIITKNVRNSIISLDVVADGVECVLSVGQDNLRGDRLGQAIASRAGMGEMVEVVRTAQFDRAMNDFDDILGVRA